MHHWLCEVLHFESNFQLQIHSLVLEIQPDVIIHTAAERRIDECEKDLERTMRINAEATSKSTREICFLNSMCTA